MSRRNLTLLCLSLLAFTLFTNANISLQAPVVRADWTLIDSDSLDHTLNSYTIVYTTWTGFAAGQRIQVDWTTGIIGVDFLIMNEANFNNYITSQLAYVELSTDGATVTVIWHVPRNYETWYGVWHNRGLLDTHLACTWYQFEWEGPPPPWYTNPFLLIVAVILTIVIIGLVVFALKRYRLRKS